MIEDLVNAEVVDDCFTDDYDVDVSIAMVSNESNNEVDVLEAITYVSDEFSQKGPWKHGIEFCTKISMDLASCRSIEKLKQSITPILNYCMHQMGPATDNHRSQAEFINLYINRDFYHMLQDFINDRMPEGHNQVSIEELLSLQKIWMLLLIYKTSYTSMIADDAFYNPCTTVPLDAKRYKAIMMAFSSSEPELDILEGTEQEVERVWGNFEQYSPIMDDLERYIGKIGKKMMVPEMDYTIDDDKLRHSSKRFRDEGLQLTGFRGSRIGPVINAMGNVQTGLIFSIHFNRHGDSAASVCQFLLKRLGYGEENTLRGELSGLVMMDRGYNLPSVQTMMIQMKLDFLGTHSEKVSEWPFWSGDVLKKPGSATAIPAAGARAAFNALRTISAGRIKQHGLIYRNGSKGIGNIATTIPGSTEWDYRVRRGQKLYYNKPIFEHDLQEEMYLKWLEDVLIVTNGQAVAPWFECRMGNLTGTTAKNVLRCLKFEFIENIPGVDQLLKVLGLDLKTPTLEQLQKPLLALKKACKVLGFMSVSTFEEANTILMRQISHESLVFKKCVASWCMAPIKQKTRETINYFRNGNLAEPKIHASIPAVVSQCSALKVELAFEVGLLQKKNDRITAVSPDAISILSSPVTIDVHDEGASKLFNFIQAGSMKHVVHIGSRYHFLCAHEYKHKSSVLTVSASTHIRTSVLQGKRFSILHLASEIDQEVFRQIIPSADYRCQVWHEAYVPNVSCVLFVVGTTSILYSVLILFPPTMLKLYETCMLSSKEKYLYWLFGEDGLHDTTLDRLLQYNIKWGYGVDRNTLKCKLQVMMELFKLRRQIGVPLPDAINIVPKYISLWNTLKGAVDDLSKVLAHTRGRWGPISPVVVIWIRVWTTCLYNSWRLHALYKMQDFVASDTCSSYQKYLDARQRLGGTWENFLKSAFNSLDLPQNLSPLSLESSSIQGTQSEQASRPTFNSTTSRAEWNTRQDLVEYRLNGSRSHVLVDIRQIPEMLGKRNIDGLVRRLCKYCSCSVRNEGKQPTKQSVFANQSYRSSSKACFACFASLCKSSPANTGVNAGKSCFDRFHSVKNLPNP